MSMVHERGIESVRRLSVHERLQIGAARCTPPPAASDLTSGYGGRTLGESAEMLELPLDTVKRRARLGLLKLHDALPGGLRAP